MSHDNFGGGMTSVPCLQAGLVLINKKGGDERSSPPLVQGCVITAAAV
ncbi:MAG: hypothetical protein HYU85_06310 [Chloroflexi bacterium]|nr:hypothetical protein [Chloroflexota bacterium]